MTYSVFRLQSILNWKCPRILYYTIDKGLYYLFETFLWVRITLEPHSIPSSICMNIERGLCLEHKNMRRNWITSFLDDLPYDTNIDQQGTQFEKKKNVSYVWHMAILLHFANHLILSYFVSYAISSNASFSSKSNLFEFENYVFVWIISISSLKKAAGIRCEMVIKTLDKRK